MAAETKIIVIGANFGGLTAALRLANDYDVVVIDPAPDFEFLPNIHELISGVKSTEQLQLSKERLLRRAGHEFVQDFVINLDPLERTVQTESGDVFSFDICVVAVGGVNNTFGVPGADEYAFPFKCVDECASIGAAVNETIAHQDHADICIVGGGLEGVECLGEILRRYRGNDNFTVHIIESSDQLLSGLPGALGAEVARKALDYPVHIHTGTRVKAVTESAVELTSGDTLPADITVWTGGATAPEILFESGLAPQENGWAPVRETLQSSEFDHIFIVGDAAELPEPISKQAYYAIDMGEHAAENIMHFMNDEPLADFEPATNLSLISFGDLDTYLVFGNTVAAGTALAPLKELIYQFNMARYEPPLNLLSFLDVQGRFWRGFFALGLPTLLSPSSLLRLGYIRLLSL